MAASITDLFTKVGNPGTATTLSAPGYTINNASINVGGTGNFPTDTAVVFGIDTATTVNGVEVRDPNSYCVFLGIVTNGTTISSLSLLYGTPQNYAAGAKTRVYITASAVYMNRLITGLLTEHKANGKHAAITADSVTTNSITINGATGTDGYAPLGATLSNITCNGNRSYSATISADKTASISPGMRLQTVRTVAAPTQCASLNGTNQYFSKTTPAGMTFTNNFVASAWVKLSSYSSVSMPIIDRYNGTSGWHLRILGGTGQVQLIGFNGGSGNYSLINSYQSVPLNKWVHITAQLDMASFTATPTTSYVMIDGVDVPSSVSRAGTNPTALVQAGDLQVGGDTASVNYFPGKIAQVAVFSAKVTQAQMRTYISQGLSGLEASLISAFSLSGASGLTDLNTTNANNLTANNSATTTNADAPFGGQAGGTISSTLDYGILTAVTSSTIAFQVAEGCTVPTSGGIASASYSTQEVPFGFPGETDKWTITSIYTTRLSQSSPTSGTAYNVGSVQLNIPTGKWNAGYDVNGYAAVGTASAVQVRADFQPTAGVYTPSSTFASLVGYASGGGVQEIGGIATKKKPLPLSSSTIYYLNLMMSSSAAGTNLALLNDFAATTIQAELAYL